MTYRGGELAERAQQEKLERELRDLEREREELSQRASELTTGLEAHRSQAYAALRGYPPRTRWLALAWVLTMDVAFLAAGLLPDDISPWAAGGVMAVFVGSYLLALRNGGSQNAQKAADEDLRARLVNLARVRARNSISPPEARVEREAEEEAEEESPGPAHIASGAVVRDPVSGG